MGLSLRRMHRQSRVGWRLWLRPWIWLALSALATAPLRGDLARVTLTVDVVAFEGVSDEPLATAVHARALDQVGTERGSTMRFDGLELPGTSVLGLDDHHVWILELDADGFWAPREIVTHGDRGVRLRAWPTGRLRGEVTVPAGEAEPQELVVRFESAATEDEGDPRAVPRATAECPVEDGTFDCEVPAGELDVRLRARGFVSHYRFGLEVPVHGSLDLGSLGLRPGASLVGSVAVDEGRLSPEDCVVALAPQTAGAVNTRREERRQQGAALDAAVRSDGFFHFEGIAPGAYRLSASQPGYATTEVTQVSVLPRSETTLERPLLLQRPVALELFLEPATDPYGEVWRVQVQREGRMPGVLDDVDEGSAGLAGSFVMHGLDPGSYVISVYDSQRGRYAWEEIELSRTTGPVFVRLEVIWAEGLVSLGDGPLEGLLMFGGRNGATRIAMESDEDGVFGGFLPRPGEWEVFVDSEIEEVSTTVTVDVEPDDQGAAAVEIELPDTEIAGEVVDHRRRSVEGAVVKAVEAHPTSLTWRRSEAGGAFRFRGLPEGTVVVDAQRPDGSAASDPVVLQVSEDRRGPELTLVLQEKASFHGRIVSPSGPVPGASVLVTPKRGGTEYPFAVKPQGVTDPTGRFTVAVPADADRLDLVIMPPGFALTTRTVPGVPDEPLEIAVDGHGGDLILQLGGPTDGAEEPGGGGGELPLVLHDGVVLGPPALHRWASLKLERNADSSRLVVPAVAPGSYTACWFSPERYARSLERGSGADPAAATAGDCARGLVPPYGELSLSLPTLERDDTGQGREAGPEPGS